MIHLQYADGPFPHSETYLTSSSSTASSLIPLQPYDITIHLHLPRNPTNLAAGNFMLDLSLISASLPSENLPSISLVLGPSNSSKLLARSRRSAILPYQSPIVSLTNTFISLPFHTLSLRDIDATSLSIPMFEQVTFARGSGNLPAYARLEVQTQPHTQAVLLGQPADKLQHVPLQVYSASIEFHARFRGLRWLMYNWKISSFLFFTGGFYCVALISTAVVWGLTTLLLPSLMPGKEEEWGQKKIKNEADQDSDLKATNGYAARPIKSEAADERGGESGEESALSLSDLADNATIFPSLGGQMPIRYPMQPPLHAGSASALSYGSGSSRIKKEDVKSDELEPLGAITAGELAEDEEEIEEPDRGRDRDRDSGIGTSMEESAREVAGLSRRRGATNGVSSSRPKR